MISFAVVYFLHFSKRSNVSTSLNVPTSLSVIIPTGSACFLPPCFQAIHPCFRYHSQVSFRPFSIENAARKPSSFSIFVRSHVQYLWTASRTFCLFVRAGLGLNTLPNSETSPMKYAAQHGTVMVRAFTPPDESSACLNSDQEYDLFSATKYMLPLAVCFSD